MLAILLGAQTLAPAPAPAPTTLVAPELSDFDLTKIARPTGDCGNLTVTSDIVVCGRLRLSARLPDLQSLDAIYGPKPFDPSVALAGGIANARVEQHTIGNTSTPAAMINFKLPF